MNKIVVFIMLICLQGCATQLINMADVPTLVKYSNSGMSGATERLKQNIHFAYSPGALFEVIRETKDQSIMDAAVEQLRTYYQFKSTERINLIVNHKLKIGMLKSDVQFSIGDPRTINRSTYSHGTNEQWIYPAYNQYSNKELYLYFDNGVLTAIQDSV